MSHGASARDRKMAFTEYNRRIDVKAAALLAGTATKSRRLTSQTQILVNQTVAELTKVMTRVLTEALSQVKSPRT